MTFATIKRERESKGRAAPPPLAGAEGEGREGTRSAQHADLTQAAIRPGGQEHVAPDGDPGDLGAPADTRPASHGWSPSFLLLFSKHVLSSTAHQALLCLPGVHSTRPAWSPDPPRGRLGSRLRGRSWQRAPASGGPAQTTALLSLRGGLVGASTTEGRLMTAHDDKGECSSLRG